MPSHSPAAAAVGAGRDVPQQAAVSALQTEDMQMQRFFSRMQKRDDAQQLITDSSSGPTVPTALSRRMLHRQGVGYLDDTVAAIASAAADRFLATVLHQSVACRDQRLIGVEKAKEAKRHRKRHMEQYEADTDDRRRRKEAIEKQREKANNAAMAAADALKKGGSTASKKGADEGTTKMKKKKKIAPGETTTKVNGNKKTATPARQDRDDDEASFDSVDEEEMFYQNYYGDPGESDESDDEDDTLRLIDLRRPLEAWDFHITGKLGLDSADADSDVEESDDDDDDDKEDDEKSEADGGDDDGDANNGGDTASGAATALDNDGAKTGDDVSPTSPQKVKKTPSAATTPS